MTPCFYTEIMHFWGLESCWMHSRSARASTTSFQDLSVHYFSIEARTESHLLLVIKYSMLALQYRLFRGVACFFPMCAQRNECRSRALLGGSGDILPLEILKSKAFEKPFSSFSSGFSHYTNIYSKKLITQGFFVVYFVWETVHWGCF